MNTRTVTHIIVHCSATEAGRDFKAADINAWHRQKGWEGIGYHYVVLLDGKVEKGRPEARAGAHAKGYNASSIGVVYIGGLDKEGRPEDTRVEAQKRALIILLKDLKRRYPKARILGHRDLPGVKKDCPCFNAEEEYARL